MKTDVESVLLATIRNVLLAAQLIDLSSVLELDNYHLHTRSRALWAPIVFLALLGRRGTAAGSPSTGNYRTEYRNTAESCSKCDIFLRRSASLQFDHDLSLLIHLLNLEERRKRTWTALSFDFDALRVTYWSRWESTIRTTFRTTSFTWVNFFDRIILAPDFQFECQIHDVFLALINRFVDDEDWDHFLVSMNNLVHASMEISVDFWRIRYLSLLKIRQLSN